MKELKPCPFCGNKKLKLSEATPQHGKVGELGFGDYCGIEQKRYGWNEIYKHKVIRQLTSNTYVDVPVQSPATETIHGQCVPVVACICCGIDETDVRKYRIEDVVIY